MRLTRAFAALAALIGFATGLAAQTRYTIGSVTVSYYPGTQIVVGSANTTLTLTGTLPAFASGGQGLCFYTGYGSTVPLIPTNGSGNATIAIPAAYLQAIPPSAFTSTTTSINASIYVLAANGTCSTAGTGATSNRTSLPVVPPSLSQVSISALSQVNTGTAFNANPTNVTGIGFGFSSSPATALQFSYSDGTVANGTPTFLSTSYLSSTVPTPPTAASSVTIRACTRATTNSNVYCSGPNTYTVASLPTATAAITATPNPASTSQAITLNATYTPPAPDNLYQQAGVDGGTANFISSTSASVIAYAPLKLDPTTALFTPQGAATRILAQAQPVGGGIADATGGARAQAIVRPNDAPNGVVGSFTPFIADFNKDGIPDVLVLDTTNNAFRLLLGTVPRGSYLQVAAPAPLPAACAGFASATVGDVNGDGYPDLIYECKVNSPTTGALASYQVYVALNNRALGFGTGGAFAAPVSLATVYGTQIALGDFNKDGKLDIITAGPVGSLTATTYQFAVYAGTGTGTFTATPTVYNISYASGSQMHVADFNGDGISDVAISYTFGSPAVLHIEVLTGTGSGGFSTTATGFDIPVGATWYVASPTTGTLPTILIVDTTGKRIGATVNVSTSTSAAFSAPPVYTSMPGLTSAAFGDVNADGNLDAVIYNGSALQAWLGNGGTGFTASFSSASGQASALKSGSVVAVADANGDGYGDVLYYNTAPSLINYITTGNTTASAVVGPFGPQQLQLSTSTPGTPVLLGGQASVIEQVNPPYNINADYQIIGAGSAGATVTLSGTFPTFSSSTFGVCFYSGYGPTAPLIPVGNAQNATLTVPASYIQSIPASAITANYGYLSISIYILAGNGTCNGSTTQSNVDQSVYVENPTLYGAYANAISQNNPNLSASANPTFLTAYGSAFSSSPLTTVSFVYGPGTYTGGPANTTTFVNGNTLNTTIPTPPAGATTVTITACTGTNCTGPYTLPVNALTALTGTLTATPNPALSTQPESLTASFGAASTAGIPTGNITFKNGSTTLGTAPLALDPTTFSFAQLDTTQISFYGGDVTSPIGAENKRAATAKVVDPVRAANAAKTTATISAIRAKVHPLDAPVGVQGGYVSPYLADFNKDGLQDVLVLNPTYISLGLIIGTIPRGDYYSVGNVYAGNSCDGYVDTAVGDLNGDGYPDIAFLCLSYDDSGNAITYVNYSLNNKASGFNAPVRIGQTTATQIAIGDVDKDGRLDIVTAGATGQSGVEFETYLQKTALTFTAGPATPTVLAAQGQLRVQDYNGDGYADLSIYNSTTASNFPTGLRIFINDKTGGFNGAGGTNIAAPATATYTTGALAAGQLPSALIIDTTGGTAEVVANTSTGGTFSNSTATYTVSNLQSAVFGDFNADGFQDIAAFDGTTVSVLTGKGTTQFAQAFTYTPSSDSTLEGGTLVAAQDQNGDGYADLLVYNPPYSGAGGALTNLITTGSAKATLNSVGPFAASTTLTATTPGTITMTAGTATTNLSISAPAAPVVTWATPTAITYGTGLTTSQLNATAATANGTPLPGTFTYNPAAGTVLGAGTQTLSVLFTPSDTTNYSTATKTVSLVVNKANPTVTWAMPAAITQGTPLSATQLNATATGVTGTTLGGTLAYTPAAGTVLGVGTQTLSVLFTPTDATDYNTATKTTTIVVGKAAPVVTWVTPAAITYGAALSATQLNATAANAAGSSLPGTFTYTPTLGTVLAAGTQALSVLFTPTDTTNYTTATKTVSLVVNKANPVVTWAMPAGITQGTALSATQLNATAAGVTGATLAGTFAYTPAAGTVLGAGTQTLSVLFTPTDTTDYNTATKTTQIAVGMATPVITWATPAAVAYGTALSATQLNATAANLAGNVLPGTFTYSPAIGAVLNAGSQTLSVLFTPTDTTNYSTATRTVTLLVNKATPVVTWTAPAGITQGTPLSATQLNATAAGITGAVLPGTFTYTPAAGTILGAGTQTLSVLFTPTDAANYSTATQTTQIAVGMATPVITWATPAAVAYGTALSATQLNATAANLAGNVLPGTFTYSPAIGAVLNAGSQTLSVLFTPTDTTNYSTATRTVTLLVNKATPAVTWTAPAGITQGTPLSATQLNATAAGITGAVLPGTFTYTPAAGTILGAGTQTLSVLFTPTDAANYSTATQTTQIAVGMATPVITWATPAAVAYGTALSATQLNATAANLAGNVLPGTFTYSPALGAVLNAGSQTLSVLFTPTDTTNYSTATRTVTLLVNKATPVVTWTAPAGITQGTPLSATQLNATAVGITGAVLPGTFTYTPAAGTILGAGTQTLSVLFTPTDAANYSTATQTTQIAVGMATPVITWATPAAVAYGTALSATQLNATAANLAGNVLPGTFTYSPALGAVLNAGSQTLSVLFTPTDTTNYSTATRTVTLLVNKATPVVTWTAPAGITQGTPLSATQLNATAAGITGAVLPGTFTYTPAAGTILGAGTQTLSVLFTPTDAANYSTATQTTQIAVGMATPVITWATPAAVAYGTALSATQLNATAANLAGNVLPGTFTYSPALGAVLNAGSQTLSVLFTPTDTTNYSTATRTVTLLVNKATPAVTWTAPAGITQGTPLSATQLNATAAGITGAVLPGTFTYTPAAGTILGAGTQTLSVLFTPTDAANYSTATQTTQIAVGMATPVITWATPAAVAYGTALSATQLNATAANLAGNVLPGTFTYSPALGAVLNAGSQTLSVLFTPTDTTNYSTATRTVTLLVNKATPVVTWTAPAGITQGTPLSATQLNATAVGITGAVLPGTFTYTPAAGTILGAGTQTLSVLFTPTDAANYSTATQTTQIAVGMATPVITWATPAAVAYGTALSATQLNATAANLAGNVLPGTFTYSPAIGAVLNAGLQTLSVLFTPTDTTNYSTATRTVTLLVNKATPAVTWTAPAGITQGTPLSATQLNATAVGITGAVLPGTFTYTPAAGTILGAGTQTLSVLFTPTDAANYSTATQTTQIAVGMATPVITWATPAAVAYGTALSATQLNATAANLAGNVLPEPSPIARPSGPC